MNQDKWAFCKVIKCEHFKDDSCAEDLEPFDCAEIAEGEEAKAWGEYIEIGWSPNER